MTRKTLLVILLFHLTIFYFAKITSFQRYAEITANGKCVDYSTAFEYFRYSPRNSFISDINDSGLVSGLLCARQCSKDGMPFGGLSAKNRCLCAPDHQRNSIEGLKKVDDRYCDQIGNYTKIFESKDSQKISGLSIVTNEPQAVGNEVIIKISFQSGNEVTFSVDFGDSNESTEWSTNTMYSHKYSLPKYYMITVKARQPEYISEKVVTEFSWVKVFAPVFDRNLQFNCPALVETDSEARCNLTINEGHHVDMSIDYGDTTGKTVYNLPNVTNKEFGASMPLQSELELLEASKLSDDQMLIIPFNEPLMHSRSSLREIEVYFSLPGAAEIYLLRTQCHNNGGSACDEHASIECTERTSQCKLSKKCTVNCDDFPPKKKMQYHVVKSYGLIRNTKGYLLLRVSSSSFRLQYGDILAYRSKGAQIARRPLKEGETSHDYILTYSGTIDKNSKLLVSGENFVKVDNAKHLIKWKVGEREPLVLTFPHRYHQIGNYPIKLNLSWTWKPVEVEDTIYVQNSIDLIKFIRTDSFAEVGNEVNVTIFVNKGSNMNVLWDFGDESVATQYIEAVSQNSSFFTQTHTYKNPGNQIVTVTVTNIGGRTSITHQILVQSPVNDIWKFGSNSPQLIPGFVSFTTEYPRNEILPTNATAVLSFGDANETEWQIPEWSEDWSGQHVIQYEYSAPNRYIALLNISNCVSNISRAIKVNVLRRITGLNVSAEYYDSDHGLYLPGIGVNSNIFSIKYPINLTINAQTGDIEHFIVRLNGTTFINKTTDKSILYTPVKPGIYDFKFSGYNHIQNESETYNLTLRLMEEIEGMNITDISIKGLESKAFLIEFEKLGTNSCLVIDCGHNKEFKAFGYRLHCEQLYPQLKFNATKNLTNPLEVWLNFPKPDDYMLTFTAANQFSNQTFRILTTVHEIDCKPPNVTIINPSTIDNLLSGKVTTFWRSKPVQLYAQIAVDCNATTLVTKGWHCYRVHQNGEAIEQIDLSSLDSYSKTFLYIPPFYMKIGYYHLTYSINMASVSSHPLLPYYASNATFIEIIPSPIIAKLADGEQSRMIRGWGQRLILSPYQYSFDPDDKNNKNFTIEWYCLRKTGEIIDFSVPDSQLKWSKPLYDRTGIEDEEYDFNDKGGCFGYGPGRINLTNNNEVDWNTTVFQKPDVIYEIIVKLIPTDRAPSWGALQLNLKKEKPPSILVKCQTASLCYPYWSNGKVGQKINPVRVGLIGACNETCEGDLFYDWTVYGVDKETEMEVLLNASYYIAGHYLPVMALGKAFFDEFYLPSNSSSQNSKQQYEDFVVKLAVTNELGVTGLSNIFLHINQPPNSGSCDFAPNEGLALFDKFWVNCSEWMDPEYEPIEYYQYWIKNVNTNAITFLMYGPKKSAHLILPYGNFIVGADIKDKSGALTRYVIKSGVSTRLPTKQMYDSYVNSKQLDNVDASGDQSLLNMISQSLSSLMNVKLPNERTTDTNTTTENAMLLMDDSEPTEKEIEGVAKTKAKMVRYVENVMNADTLTSLEHIGCALTSLAGDGKVIDNEAKDRIIQLLNKTVIMAQNIEVESPQQLLDFCMYAVGTMGGIVNRMTEQLISRVVMPNDRSNAWSLDYSVEVPDEDENEEYILDSKSSVLDALSKAVIENERKAAETQITQLKDLTRDLVLAMIKKIIVGESALEFTAPSGLALTINMYSNGSLSHRTIKQGDSTYIFPHICDILADQSCFGNETLGTLAISWPAILESYGNSVELLSKDTKTLQLLVLDRNCDIIIVQNTSDMFSIIVPRKSSGVSTPVSSENGGTNNMTFVIPQNKLHEDMVYHRFQINKSDSALNIEISPTNINASIILYFQYNEKPMLDFYEFRLPLRVFSNRTDLRVSLSTSGLFDIFLSNSVINNRTGYFYLGVVEVDEQSLRNSDQFYILDDINFNNISSVNYTAGESNYTLPEITANYSTNYFINTFTSGCYFFDYDRKIWSGDGCYVEEANQMMTHCKCNHLTSFGSGFFVMPNTIDFDYVFANAGFTDNITIYMTIIITILIYFALLVWARRADRIDLTKLGATPLPDNDPQSKYLYEITVYTGDKDGAGTDSKVCFILSGDDDETDVRTFDDPNRKIFRRAAMDLFVMAVPRRLGRLNYCRLWHDNSGEGKMRSWFLCGISVKDVQTDETFEFGFDKWFACEKNDGLVDRLIPVAGLEEATGFSHLFEHTAQKNLADDHLWFSVFMRPPRSRFTRVQRVSCCMALLYLTMLVNAMWYERVSPKPNDSALEIGPFSLSPEQIGIGFFSNLIVFPPTFLIILLFRRSRLRTLRPSRISEALRKQNLRVRQTLSAISANRSAKQNKVGYSRISFDSSGSGEKVSKRKKKKRLMFPWYCRYIGWFLCAVSILVSIFFLMAYGIQFGDEKTRKWVTSLVISFFASILVTQPIKVFLTAMILSTLFKTPNSKVDDSEEDEEELDFDLLPDEEWLHTTNMTKKKTRSGFYKPQNMLNIERMKLQRLKELRMAEILKDIISYLLFLYVLTVISYGNRDPNAYLMKESLEKAFIDGTSGGDKFMDIKNTKNIWSWTKTTLIPELLVGKWYNDFTPFGWRGFLNDRTNRMIGYGVLRQVRVKHNTCAVNEKLKKFGTDCRGFSKIIDEDHDSYRSEWTQPSNDSYFNDTIASGLCGEINPSKSKKDEWNYRTPSELDGLPFWGKLDVYSGGGYVIPLRGERSTLIEEIKKIESQHWIDQRTRAVFAEFSVYNAQVNLFGVITSAIEFQPGGGTVPNYRIEIVRLMRYHQGFGLFILLCEISYVAFIVFFTQREIRNMRNEGKRYFASYWNWAEVIIIALSYTAIGLYIYRLILTQQMLAKYVQTEGKCYIKLQYVTTVDEVFGYIIAFTMFVGMLKFIRLLRFNKRMGILYSTLAQCSKDLQSFCIVFLIVFFAFVQMFYLVFGSQISSFASIVDSAETSFGMVTGKFDFDEMCRANRFLGPLVFFVFVLIAPIVLVNIFLTLIISAFETVKNNVEKQNNEYEIMEFIANTVKKLFGFNNDSIIQSQDTSHEKIGDSLDEQLSEFPEKIDRLLNYFNDVYFNGKLEIGDQISTTEASVKRSARVTPTQVNTKSGANKRGDSDRNSLKNSNDISCTQRVTNFDWFEINNDEHE